LFLDQVNILLKSGNGGSGAISFRREKYVPRGGPDGGDGGRGGHVIFVARDNLSTLSEFQYKHHFQASHGSPGEASNRSGKDGADLYIPVPPGTVVKNAATHQIITDLTENGTKFIVLKGGRGGRGNSHFASATRQTPHFSEKGELGFELRVELELKLIADVGLIGYPNAGKSTLLAKLSAARPKIADYPFTTIIPNLGVVNYKNQSFIAVDIPGLIAGAHQGVGLGDQFLRHIERTRILVHLVDVSGFSERDPYQDFLQVNRELKLFSPNLGKKIQIIAATKIDLPESRPILEAFCQRIEGARAADQNLTDQIVIPISAVTGAGINDLLNKILAELAKLPPEEPQITGEADPDFDISGADHYGIDVVHDGPSYRVQNDSLVRRIARFDLSNEESIQSLQRLLKRWGVITALIEAGIKEGDLVRIGNFEFIYHSEA
jgi:GTP-binding protein